MEAARMAKLMRSREEYRVGFIDVGGWDTHVAQGAAAGQLANKLKALGEGLAAFADSLGAAWGNTVVAVISEFGRTFCENGARGTDHGHGSLVWLLGSESPGAGIQGEQAAFTQQPFTKDGLSLSSTICAKCSGRRCDVCMGFRPKRSSASSP
jgi:uncharacterized protein (DUF1501 family)